MNTKILTFMVLSIFTLAMTSPALATEWPRSDIENLDHAKMGNKLKRGAINVLTSPIEVPKNISSEVKENNQNCAQKILAAIGGTAKGLSYGVLRLGSGLWDVATFNIETPDHYEPLLKPDYVCENSTCDLLKKKK